MYGEERPIPSWTKIRHQRDDRFAVLRQEVRLESHMLLGDVLGSPRAQDKLNPIGLNYDTLFLVAMGVQCIIS